MAPKPLVQDNVEMGLLMLGQHSRLVHWAIHLQWANILHYLGAMLALAFSVIWDQVGGSKPPFPANNNVPSAVLLFNLMLAGASIAATTGQLE